MNDRQIDWSDRATRRRIVCAYRDGEAAAQWVQRHKPHEHPLSDLTYRSQRTMVVFHERRGDRAAAAPYVAWLFGFIDALDLTDDHAAPNVVPLRPRRK